MRNTIKTVRKSAKVSKPFVHTDYKQEDVAATANTLVKDNDPINPHHYNQGPIECIDALHSALTREEMQGFLKGQVVKYTWRMNLKGTALQDAQKAEWYLQELIELLGGETRRNL